MTRDDAIALFSKPHPYWQSVRGRLLEMASNPDAPADTMQSYAGTLRLVGRDRFFREAQPAEADQLMIWADALEELAAGTP